MRITVTTTTGEHVGISRMSPKWAALADAIETQALHGPEALLAWLEEDNKPPVEAVEIIGDEIRLTELDLGNDADWDESAWKIDDERGRMVLAVIATDALRALELLEPLWASSIVGSAYPPPGVLDLAGLAARAGGYRLTEVVNRIRASNPRELD